MIAPIIFLLRNRLGKTKFNQLRGQAIAIHAQAITNICTQIGIHRNVRQNFIRLARDNGKKLGLLA